jgi:hypothetical protein
MKKTPTKPAANRGGRPAIKRLAPAAPTTDPLEFMLRVINDKAVSDRVRLDAAIAAARYVHRKPHQVGKREAAQEAGEKAGTKGRFQPPKPPARVLNFAPRKPKI